MSLVFIGDIADHLECFMNLEDGFNAIATVALGTSVPGPTVGHEFSQNFSVLCSVGISTFQRRHGIFCCGNHRPCFAAFSYHWLGYQFLPSGEI